MSLRRTTNLDPSTWPWRMRVIAIAELRVRYLIWRIKRIW